MDKALDLNNYDKTVEKMSEYYVSEELCGKTDGNSKEKAIDILRRLVKNTMPEENKAPRTKYENLNKLMTDINPVVNIETGEIHVSLQEVGTAIAELNKVLFENKNRQGIFPSTISVVAYLDKMASSVIRDFSKKEISEVIYDPSFKEILRFSQLTSSTEYDNSTFENFYNQVCDNFSKAYDGNGIDSDAVETGGVL